MAKKQVEDTMFGLGLGQITAVTKVTGYGVVCVTEECGAFFTCGPLVATAVQQSLSAAGWVYDAASRRWGCPECAAAARAAEEAARAAEGDVQEEGAAGETIGGIDETKEPSGETVATPETSTPGELGPPTADASREQTSTNTGSKESGIGGAGESGEDGQ